MPLTHLAVLLVSLTACTPADVPGPAGGSARAAEPPAQTPKTLTLALQREEGSFEGFRAEGRFNTVSGRPAYHLVHDELVVADPRDVYHPQLATELPSPEKGTWRVNADGTMDMIWRLRANVRWHDGVPFTAHDLLFSYALYQDPDLPHGREAETRLMESARAPDPYSLAVHWSRIHVDAIQANGLVAFPRHLLEEPYRADKSAFVNHPRFGAEWVGLGPYKLVTWEPGSHLEMVRFEDYYLGRPPVDRVVVRFIADSNAMLSNMLAETVDLIFPPSVDLAVALELKERWAGTGNIVRVEPIPRIVPLWPQFRPELARPVNGLDKVAGRRALFQAIDRETLAQVMTAGLAPSADSWYLPTHPLRQDLEASIPKYPYDVSRAQELLAQVGWERGRDGILTHGPTGERFEIEIWVQAQALAGAGAIVADNWKALGAEVKLNMIPPARTSDREYLNQQPGVWLAGVQTERLADRFDSRTISSAVNRWRGRNWLGYSNPAADSLLDQLSLTIEPSARRALLREQVRELMGDLTLMPLYWEPGVTLVLSSVRADAHPHRGGWNAFTWDKV